MILKFFDVDRFVLREALEKEIKEIDREIDSTEDWQERVVLEERQEVLKTMIAQIPDVTNIAA